MKSLTIAYCSAREHPEIEWFLDSLRRECEGKAQDIEVIFVDFLYGKRAHPKCQLPDNFRHVSCKPTVWQGEHRLTRDHWWSKSAYLNTALCLAKGEWFAGIDDRSVLIPGWLARVKEAMRGDYAVAGSYSKRVDMRVEDGIVVEPGTSIGKDPRLECVGMGDPIQTYGEAWFGCNWALPLEWALNLNGVPEQANSLGYEDVLFGHMLIRNGLLTKFDSKMAVLQDRTQPYDQSLVKRTDKNDSPNDKSHALEKLYDGVKRSTHCLDIRVVRSIIQEGGQFPPDCTYPVDWYDAQPLEDFP